MLFEFDWVDAFSDAPFGGNGCAVVHGAQALSPETCMAFVRETGLVECTFVGQSETADWHVRYCMADREIPFAGHPTLATAASLADRGLANTGQLTFETGAGIVPVEIGDGAQPLITMTQVAPEFGPQIAAEVVAEIGQISPDEIIGTPQIVSTGLPFVVTLLRDKAVQRTLRLDVEALQKLPSDPITMEPFWVTLGGETNAGATFARLLLGPPLPPEDPFTGSATGAMAAYLWAHGLVDKAVFTAEQGHWMGRPGAAQVEVLGPRDAITGVRVGGRGYVLMRGTVDL